MIKHMVLFRFRPETGEHMRARVLDGMRALPSRFPAMKRFALGENVSKRDRTFTHAMTIEFDELEQLEAYLDAQDHESFVVLSFRPHVEERAIMSFVC